MVSIREFILLHNLYFNACNINIIMVISSDFLQETKSSKRYSYASGAL